VGGFRLEEFGTSAHGVTTHKTRTWT